jgi:glutamyl-tRNA reductase
MSIIAFGINHKTAPVEIREKVAFSPTQLPEALKDLVSHPHVDEAAIVSTCNRTELYCGLVNENLTIITEWFQEYHKLNGTDISPYIYTLPDRQAVRHALRVASGLDSMVLGEPQILGQMKEAYSVAAQAGTLGGLLDKLFQHTFSVALLIGAGETIELTARHLHESGMGRMIIANRTVERAHNLASEFDAYAISLPEIPKHLAEADIVISSTASPLPILGKGSVESAIKVRKHRPILMVDIAVPRDIETEVGDLDDVYLYTVDDMQEIIQEGLKSRQEAAAQAEDIIDTQVSHFMNWIQSLGAVSTIRGVREQAIQLRDDELQQALKLIQAGKDPQQVLEQFAHRLTNKLIHQPSVQLKQAAYDGRIELLDAAREIFNLKDADL